MNVKVIIITAALALLKLKTAMAQGNPQMFTLQQCLDFAVNNSYVMQKAALDVKEAAYKAGEAKAGLFPQVSGSGALDDNIRLPVMLLPGEIVGQEPGTQIAIATGTQYVVDFTARAEQVIFDPALFVGIKIARSSEELQKLRSRMTEEDLIYEVSALFYDVLSSMKELVNIRYTLSRQDSLHTLMQGRVREDLAREVDLNRIKVSVTNLKVRCESIQATIAQRKKYLQTLMGMPLNVDFDLDDTALSDVLLPSKAPFILPENKVELDILYREKDLANLELKQLRAGYLPTLSAVVSGSCQLQSEKLNLSQGPWFSSSLTGLRLSVPIFDGLRKRNQVMQTKMRLQKLETDILETRQTVRMSCENAAAQLAVTFQSVKAQEENLQLAEKVYRQTSLLYVEGLSSLTDLLEAEASLREAQILHVTEIISYRKTEIDLMKAEGNLTSLLNNKLSRDK
jgi:outer membrane protein TolC